MWVKNFYIHVLSYSGKQKPLSYSFDEMIIYTSRINEVKLKVHTFSRLWLLQMSWHRAEVNPSSTVFAWFFRYVTYLIKNWVHNCRLCDVAENFRLAPYHKHMQYALTNYFLPARKYSINVIWKYIQKEKHWNTWVYTISRLTLNIHLSY
jgi:hypothetical protein